MRVEIGVRRLQIGVMAWLCLPWLEGWFGVRDARGRGLTHVWKRRPQDCENEGVMSPGKSAVEKEGV